jgi:exonuclease VII small subunit
MRKNVDIRRDALTQLKKAQQMIEEGRKELAAANQKIRVAQKLINESADALRDTPVDRPPVARPR